VDGTRLDDDAILAFLRLLIPAGVENTYRALGNLLFALLTHPEQLADVTRSPVLRNAAIEEGLRWEAPVVMTLRRATQSTQLAGVEIPKGSDVAIYLSAANRDPRRYRRPDEFDIHREPMPHLTFGSGPHACLGRSPRKPNRTGRHRGAPA
jgi:cytochrome P450